MSSKNSERKNSENPDFGLMAKSNKHHTLEEIDQNRETHKIHIQKNTAVSLHSSKENPKICQKSKTEDNGFSSSIKHQKLKRVNRKEVGFDTGKKEKMVTALKHLCHDLESEF